MELGLYAGLALMLFIPELPHYVQGMGAAITVFFWLVLILLSDRFPYLHYPWNTTLLLLNLWCWASLLWSVDPAVTRGYCIIVSAASILIVLLSSVLTTRGARIRFVLALLTCGIYLSLTSVGDEVQHFLRLISSEFFTPDMLLFRTSGLSRISGSMGGPNTIGGVMGLLIPFLGAFLFYGFPLRKSHRWYHNLFHVLAMLLCVLGCFLFFNTLILSASRGAFMGLLAGLIALMMIPRSWLTNVQLLLLMLSFYLIPEVKGEALRFYERMVDETRYVIFQNSWELALLVPFTGVGLGAFVVAYERYFSEAFIHAHSLYLNVWVELGLPGALLALLLSGQFLYYGITLTLRSSQPFDFAFKAGLSALLVSLLVRCLLDYTL